MALAASPLHGVYAGQPLLPHRQACEPHGQDTLLVRFVQHRPDGTSSICHSALHHVDWMGPCSTYPVWSWTLRAFGLSHRATICVQPASGAGTRLHSSLHHVVFGARSSTYW